MSYLNARWSSLVGDAGQTAQSGDKQFGQTRLAVGRRERGCRHDPGDRRDRPDRQPGIKLLAAAGERPRAFVRDVAVEGQRLGEQVEHVAGDLDRPETVDAALADVDRVFLLTTQHSRQPQWEQLVIQAAGRAGVGHVVKLSVVKADERAPLQIARQHWQVEQALERSGLAYTIVRPLFSCRTCSGW
jgi:hypothetical protein